MEIKLPYSSKHPISLIFLRGNYPESEHLLDVALYNAEGKPIIEFGNMESIIYPRSAIKPLQSLALALLKPDLSEKEYSVICSSHNGQYEHIEIVSKILKKYKIKQNLLICGSHWSLDQNSLINQIQNNTPMKAILNNCSGKHAGMLVLAKLLKANFQGYEKLNHPVQKQIILVLNELLGFDIMKFPYGIDGCGVPAFSAPINKWAIGFARFANYNVLNKDLFVGCEKIVESIAREPFMLAGDNRLCTEISKQFGKNITAKVGAEGVYACSFNNDGLGLVIKSRDGAKRATEFVLGKILALLGYGFNYKLKKMFSDEIRNWKGDITGYKRLKIVENEL